MNRSCPLKAVLSVLAVVAALKTPVHAEPASHPCVSDWSVTGFVADGSNPSLFSLSGDERSFKLGGLAPLAKQPPPLKPQKLRLYSRDATPDRYGRIVVQAFSVDGDWIQGRMLKGGETFHFGLGEASSCVDAMRDAEAAARRSGSGLWKLKAPVFEAKNTDALLQQTGKFTIITGTVRSIGDRKRRVYLNFGSNWVEDVTAVAVKKGSGAYLGDVAVLQTIEGKRVEIRGIAENAQGPLIRLIDDAQIDIIDR